MTRERFCGWLAAVLGAQESEVALILDSEDALHFLIAWSLFEAKCFDGFMKSNLLAAFSTRLGEDGRFDVRSVRDAARHFHARYQKRDLYKNLVRGHRFPAVEQILGQTFETLTSSEEILLLATTIYRFRNNIFHGNKRVRSWLSYREEIRFCTTAMQSFISHAEARRPTLAQAAE